MGPGGPSAVTAYMRHPVPWGNPTADRIALADAYLAARTGCFEMRCERYDAALEVMHGLGLDDSCTVLDVGAGMGEFGARLHAGAGLWDEDWDGNRYSCEGVSPPSRARYVPVDAAIDGTDLEHWCPPRRVEFIVCLEVLEHLRNPARLLTEMIAHATRGVVVSTPNPERVDVLSMDATHRTPISRSLLEMAGMRVEARSFYGAEDDSLFGVWAP
jgi:2-polyprenyl-3-methyl-5-hydroxy-6-metoxy-1,4-benzoquinol methylase